MFQGSDEIVIAEDNAMLLSVLREIFTERGYSVRIASDGLAALALIRTKAPGLLLSDLRMPRMSGLELLSIVRRHYPVIKVIAMSGSYHGEGIPPGVAAGAFYPKGASSVVRLLQRVTSLRDENELRSRRVSTPIWIPRQALTTASESGGLFVNGRGDRANVGVVSEDADKMRLLILSYVGGSPHTNSG